MTVTKAKNPQTLSTEIVKARKEQIWIQQIAEELEVDIADVEKVLLENGINIRDHETIEERNSRIIALREDNVSVAKIAALEDMGTGNVYTILKKAGKGSVKVKPKCKECIDELTAAGNEEPELFAEESQSSGLCWRHYQRRYRAVRAARQYEENELVDYVDPISGKTIKVPEFVAKREKRKQAHREAQQRYFYNGEGEEKSRNPQAKAVLDRYRKTKKGKEANHRAVSRYRKAQLAKEALAKKTAEDRRALSRSRKAEAVAQPDLAEMS